MLHNKRRAKYGRAEHIRHKRAKVGEVSNSSSNSGGGSSDGSSGAGTGTGTGVGAGTSSRFRPVVQCTRKVVPRQAADGREDERQQHGRPVAVRRQC